MPYMLQHHYFMVEEHTVTSVDLTIFEGGCGVFMCPLHLSMFHFTRGREEFEKKCVAFSLSWFN